MSNKRSDFRARMPHWFAEFAEPIRKMGQGAFSKLYYNDAANQGETSKEETKNSINLAYKGRRSLTSLEDALAFFEIDLERFDVERFVANAWDVTNGEGETYTNYQVKLFLRKIDDDDLLVLEELKKQMDKAGKKIKIPTQQGRGIGVASFADFHIGADIKGLINTKDFNINILIQYLHKAAAIINAKKYKEVHVALLGDYVHSISGLMHLTDWHDLGYNQHGGSVIILASELIRDHLLSQIKNLAAVYMVSGNHDRLSAHYKGDPRGEGARLVHYNLMRDFPDIPVKYDPLIYTVEIDGVYYMLSHGHHKLTEKDSSNLLFEYGKQGLFNVLLRGHKHTVIEKGKKKVKTIKYEDYYITQIDNLMSRFINIPSLYTGDLYSESLGYTANGGFSIIENNGTGLINQQTLAL